VPQVPRLLSDSLRDNLLLGHEETDGLPVAVRIAVLDRDVASMPSKLDTEVGARGVRLSGGKVQRAAIARALVRRSDPLVLDDVLSALDVETERQLWDRLLAEEALLVVANRAATSRADQVIRLDHGRVQPGSVYVGATRIAAAA
jgi:ATP-binding cassette subfamily B protein